MLKSAMMLGATLCAGILLGVIFAISGPFTGSTANPTSMSQPHNADPSISAASQTTAPSPLISAENETTARLAQEVLALGARLDEEADLRNQLEAELSRLSDQLQTLEQRLDELTEQEPEPDVSPPRVSWSRQINSAMFVEAGFSQDEAEWLSTLWGQQQMELLYLRDEASREGWLNTPRYREAMRDLRNGEGSLRDEVGLDMYDRFLFATGQSNRVVLDSVIESSPAQAIGLQPGDTILTYDGSRILTAPDLRTATSAGEPGVPVVIEVERDGQLIEFQIARGPIGVTLGTRRVEP